MNKKLALFFSINLFFSTLSLYSSQESHAIMALAYNSNDKTISKVIEIGNLIAINQAHFVDQETISTKRSAKAFIENIGLILSLEEFLKDNQSKISEYNQNQMNNFIALNKSNYSEIVTNHQNKFKK